MTIVITAATNMEMQAYADACKEGQRNDRGKPLGKTMGEPIGERRSKGQAEICHLITGIGPVETTLTLTRFLQGKSTVSCVINLGIAGAYLENGSSTQADLLDICLADQEVLGDFGIQLEDRVEKFGNDLPVHDTFVFDPELLAETGCHLKNHGISYKVGTFVTVNCASGTLQRGNQLGRQFHGLCENMEGAAVARICEEFSLPCLEIRCISNMVEDRNRENWQIREACGKVGQVVTIIIDRLAAEMKA